jgi:hypothetical protein
VHGTVGVRKLQVGKGIEIHGPQRTTTEGYMLAGAATSKNEGRGGRAGLSGVRRGNPGLPY